MKKYKFEQFNLEMVNPIVTILKVSDNILTKECEVEVLLETETTKFGVSLDGFTYQTNWYDDDVINWVNNVKLPEFEINIY